MLRILKDFDCNETLLPLADVLNPNKHFYHAAAFLEDEDDRDVDIVSMSEWMHQMSVLCSADNIVNHPECYSFTSDTSLGRSMLIDISSRLQTLGKQWMLPFFYVGGDYCKAYVIAPDVSVHMCPQHFVYENGRFNETIFNTYVSAMSAAWTRCSEMDARRFASFIDLGNIGVLYLAMFSGHPYIRNNETGRRVGISELVGQQVEVIYNPAIGDVRFNLIPTPVSSTDRSRLYQLQQYRSDPRRQIANQIVSKKKHARTGKEHQRQRDNLLYGIELELSTQHSVRQLIDSQEFPFFICKQDGSISGAFSGMYECVTVPMDYRGQRQAWGKFFAKFYDQETKSYKGFDTTTDTSNGMHIHLTRKAFEETPKHLERFAWFICDPCNYDFILAISERGGSLGEYAKTPQWPARTSRKKMFDNTLAACGNMRGAVNLRSSTGATVEVRLFKGIVSYASLLKNLEFVDALYHFTQALPYSKITVEHFVEWINGKMKECPCPRQYKALRLFINEMEPEVFENIRTNMLIASATTEDALVRSVARGDIKVSKGLLELMNRRFPRARGVGKTFSLKNGQLLLSPDLYSQLKRHEEALNPYTQDFTTTKKAA